MLKKTIVCLAIALSAGSLAACDRVAENAAEKVIENQTGGKVDIDKRGESVEIKTDKGTIKVGQNKLPAGFPKDVPIHKSLKVQSSISGSAEQESFTVTLTAKGDAVEELGDFYAREMPKEGWKQQSTMDAGEGTSRVRNFSFEKDGRQAGIMLTFASSEKEETSLLISVSKP